MLLAKCSQVSLQQTEWQTDKDPFDEFSKITLKKNKKVKL